MARRTDTRARMVNSAIALMQRNGAAAVTVDAVLVDSGAPRGSVYHHFPAGRDQIVHDALRAAGSIMTARITASAEKPPRESIDSFFGFWRDLLTTSDFTAGCPIAGAALGGAESDPTLHDEVASIFAGWHTLLTQSITAVGVDPTRARSLATMLVAATEGALILARIQRSMTPVDDVAAELHAIVDVVLPAT